MAPTREPIGRAHGAETTIDPMSTSTMPVRSHRHFRPPFGLLEPGQLELYYMVHVAQCCLVAEQLKGDLVQVKRPSASVNNNNKKMDTGQGAALAWLALLMSVNMH